MKKKRYTLHEKAELAFKEAIKEVIEEHKKTADLLRSGRMEK